MKKMPKQQLFSVKNFIKMELEDIDAKQTPFSTLSVRELTKKTSTPWFSYNREEVTERKLRR